MDKKITILGIAFAIVAFSQPVYAQQVGKVFRIGYFHFHASPKAIDQAFVRALRDLGWIEGKNIAIEYRWGAWADSPSSDGRHIRRRKRAGA